MVVLVFDRGTLYFADTAPNGRVSWIAWIVRAFLVLGISAVTSLAINSVVLKRELIQHARVMKEANEDHRLKKADTDYGISAQQKRLDTLSDDAKKLEREMVAIPPQVASLQAQAQRAGDALQAERQRLGGLGMEQSEILAATADANRRWIALRAEAARVLRDHRETKARELRATNDQRTAVGSRLTETIRNADEFMADGRKADVATLDEFNANVLTSLIRSSPGAFLKWLLTTAGLFMLELLPFVLKGTMVAQSVPGLYRANERHEIELQMEQDRETRDNNHMHFLELMEAARSAHGPRNERMRKMVRESYDKFMEITVPLMSARDSARTLLANADELGIMQRKSPKQVVPIIAMMWGEAMRDMNAVLAKHRNETMKDTTTDAPTA
jgi:hypothetical protein